MAFLAMAFILAVAAATNPKHVVMTVIDDLGFDDFGFANGGQINTPTFDAMHDHGVHFDIHSFVTGARKRISYVVKDSKVPLIGSNEPFLVTSLDCFGAFSSATANETCCIVWCFPVVSVIFPNYSMNKFSCGVKFGNNSDSFTFFFPVLFVNIAWFGVVPDLRCYLKTVTPFYKVL